MIPAFAWEASGDAMSDMSIGSETRLTASRGRLGVFTDAAIDD